MTDGDYQYNLLFGEEVYLFPCRSLTSMLSSYIRHTKIFLPNHCKHKLLSKTYQFKSLVGPSQVLTTTPCQSESRFIAREGVSGFLIDPELEPLRMKFSIIHWRPFCKKVLPLYCGLNWRILCPTKQAVKTAMTYKLRSKSNINKQWLV